MRCGSGVTGSEGGTVPPVGSRGGLRERQEHLVEGQEPCGRTCLWSGRRALAAGGLWKEGLDLN